MERTIVLASDEEARALFGTRDSVLRALDALTTARVTARGTEVRVVGPERDVDALVDIVQELLAGVREGHTVTELDVDYLGRRALAGEPTEGAALFGRTILVTERGKRVRPRSVGQRRYVEAVRAAPITFGIGPAGTGKTYLAMACAVSDLNEHRFERIILTRPAVEAGESLGFLPGDLREKVDPYLRPLYDALYDMIRVERAQKLMERGTIEVVPLAYMRGRTLNDAVIILDEAQNTTEAQMKMFLTRMGYSSKAIITGDVTQIDLPAGKGSGLLHASRLLRGIEGIAFVELSGEDVVRHPLVRDIIRAYEDEATGEQSAAGEGDFGGR